MSADFCGWCAVGAPMYGELISELSVLVASWLVTSDWTAGFVSFVFKRVSLADWNLNLPHQAVMIWCLSQTLRPLLWHVVHDVLDEALHGAACAKLLLCFSLLCMSVHTWFFRCVCLCLHASCLSLALLRRPWTWLCSCYKPSLSLSLCFAEVCLTGPLWLMTTQGLMNACEGRGHISTWHSKGRSQALGG